jgi:hypothetical protein
LQQLPLQAGFYRGDKTFTSADGNRMERKDELTSHPKTCL